MTDRIPKTQIKSTASNRLSQYNHFIDSRQKYNADEGTKLSNILTKRQKFFAEIKDLLRQAIDFCYPLLNKRGVHSVIALAAAGFHYTGVGDTARCIDCDLEVSGWTLDMHPFTIHSKRSPSCKYVRSIISDEKNLLCIANNFLPINSNINNGEKPAKRQKIEVTQGIPPLFSLIETEKLKASRKRSFSHWPSRQSPSSAQMIAAGFFPCNVGDRVICIYCNLICQQWTPNTDDPLEVHKKLSPHCPYTKAILNSPPASSIMILNEPSTNASSLTSNTIDPFQSDGIVFTNSCHTAYIEVPRRLVTFETWPKENLPSSDDLVRAGFFYTGTKTIVTCFYCNGSLQNWGAHDNPTIEHARWFPNCAYIKQLCGPELYQRIQESKRAQQERNRANGSDQQANNNTNNTSRAQLHFPDESTLSRYVAARLDLGISQSLLNQNFKLSIIKRCWEDQLRLKHDDFNDDSDLRIAAMILQKQIEYIDGKKENITIPSVAMNNIRQKEQEAIHAREQAGASVTVTHSSIDTEMETITSSRQTGHNLEAMAVPTNEQQTRDAPSSTINSNGEGRTDSSSPTNPCAICHSEEKRLACIPCGHLATCVPCGHSLRLCPICRREIEAFVRIFL